MHPLALVFVPCLAGALAAQMPVAPLVGTVLDPDGKPVAGAPVLVSRCDGRLFSCLDLELRAEWIEVARATTDKNGRFGLQAPVGLALAVAVDAPPFARWRSESVVPGDQLAIRLEPACVVHGRLVDEAGAGVPGLVVATASRTMIEVFRGRTDADGRFRAERLPSGASTWKCEPEHAASPAWLGRTLDRGEVLELEFACRRGTTMTGTITDAATGAAIAGAAIGEGWVLHKRVPTDARGEYTLRGRGSAGYGDVHVTAPGYARRSFRDLALATDPLRLDVELERGVDIVGRVVDESGEPLGGAYVAAIGVRDNTIPWQPTRSAPDGTFVCSGFPRGLDGVLMVRCYGHASAVWFLPRPAGDGQIDFGTVKLRPPALVRGVVRDDAGQPVAGAVVALRGVNADAATLAVAPAAWGFLANYAGARQSRTDAAGAFAFGDVSPGRYELTFDNEPGAPITAVEVAAGAILAPIELLR